MRLLHKFLSLRAGERAALLEAWALLSLLRVALRVVRLPKLRAALLRLARFGSKPEDRLTVNQLVWLVETARRYCPIGSTCLSAALTAETLLCRHGHEPVLCIGATRKDGAFTAHAWIENAGAVVIGGPASFIQQYTRFPDLHGSTL